MQPTDLIQPLFRQATAADAGLLTALRLRFLQELKGPATEAEAAVLAEQLMHYFQKAIPSGACVCWLACSGEQAAGAGAMVIREQPGHFQWPEGKLGYILNMYTLPEYRRQGIGSGILERLIADARTLGLGRVELHASEAGEPVYRRQGFVPHTEPALVLQLR
jgi:GNAT superfamily N-acetyltransferase